MLDEKGLIPAMRAPVPRSLPAVPRECDAQVHKAMAIPIWARLLVQSLQAPTEFARSVRANLKRI